MKHLNLIIGGILLVLNILIGLIVSSYSAFNVCLTSGIIVISFALIEALKHSKLHDAFRISLTFIFVFLMIVGVVLGVLSPETFKDNWYFITIIIILVIEIIILLTSSFISQKVQTN